jgi:hypothetical protein
MIFGSGSRLFQTQHFFFSFFPSIENPEKSFTMSSQKAEI